MWAYFSWAVAAWEAANDHLEEIAKFMHDHSTPLTIGIAVALVVVKICLRLIFRRMPCATATLCVDDFLNGGLIFPFGSMCLSALSPSFLPQSEDGRLMIAMAGAIGIFHILDKLSRLS